MRAGQRLVIACAILVLAPIVIAQQQPPPPPPPSARDLGRPPVAPLLAGTGRIAGVVMSDGEPAQPIRRVTVTLSETGGATAGRAAVTDDDGRFAFADLPAGRYLVSASKPAYLPTAYGVTKPMRPGAVFTGTGISLGDGQRLDNLRLRITRGGVVTGTIRSPDGRPVRDALVVLAYFRRDPQTGARTLTPVPDARTASDGRGIYRIFGIPPGEYLVILQLPYGFRDLEQTTAADLQRATELARPGGGTAGGIGSNAASALANPARPKFGYAPVFYPGSSKLSDAVALTLNPGEERGGVDFEARLVPNARIVGSAIGPDGRPVIARITATSVVGNADFLGQFASSDAQGRFTVTGLEPGSYSLEASTPAGRGGPGSVLAGQAVVAIENGGDVPVTVTLQPTVSVSGRVVIDDAAAPPVNVSQVRITLMREATAGGLASAIPAADGTFTAAGVFPGRYRLTAIAPPPAPGSVGPTWFMKSATIGERDAMDRSFEVSTGADITGAVVTLTTRASQISGAIQDASGRPAPEYFVIAFPADRALWTWNSRRIQQTRPLHDGTFAFKNLPPGEYMLGAVTDVDQYEWFEPAFLNALFDASVKVSLAEGQKVVQNLRLK